MATIRPSRFLHIPILGLLLVAGTNPALAADEPSGITPYQVPDQALVDIVDAPLTPSVEVSPTAGGCSSRTPRRCQRLQSFRSRS